ncbi:AfsA-related hotdog domain-containing protein [Streptomyces jumonjinensis]|uniref:AfsA-related hotdog domain-containing protein n=1 Tax=Streptomyces jumonjinensis TaxID=1945 RepID=UPI003792B09B
MSTHDSEAARLRFDRTVDRRLLHRRALSEVFLTDSADSSGNVFLVGAQLPSSHAYFIDHADHTVIDPILLLECARQAETYCAHVHLGVGEDTKFVLRRWSMRLPGLFAAHAGNAAGLTMEVTPDRPAGAVAPARSLAYDIAFSLGGGAVGNVRMEVGYLSSAAYSYVRTARRGSPPPSSDEVPVTRATVAPASVGRSAEVNTLLIDPERTGTGMTAALRLPGDNPSMFDHAQDHLPGMVLTEAARQLCLLTGAELLGRAATGTTLVGFDLTFSRFAELDSLTTVTATPGTSDDGTQGFAISVRQDGEEIVNGTVDTTAVPASHQRAK